MYLLTFGIQTAIQKRELTAGLWNKTLLSDFCNLPVCLALLYPPQMFQSRFGWRQTNCVLKWQWERRKRKKEAKGAELQDSLESSMRPCLSLLLPPIASTGNRLMHTRAPTVPGHLWSAARWVGEHHRPRTSLAARQSASWAPGPACWNEEDTLAHKTRLPPTVEHGHRWGKMVDEAQHTHAHMEPLLGDELTQQKFPIRGFLRPQGGPPELS